MDMWNFDLNSEEWSPVSIQSTEIPSPRSEFAHVKDKDSFIIFGGQGDAGLFNDLYTFKLKSREWETMQVSSANRPTPRRAACLATNYDELYIFGGISETGYMNELWKYSLSNNTYENIAYTNVGPPAVGFSNCFIYTNSYRDDILQIYMGENNGETPLSIIYEFNLRTKIWTQIRNQMIGFDEIARTKSAAFRILDKLIIAGGVKWDFGSYKDINILDIKTGKSETVGYLPSYIFFGASAYYKDKIYIHGGAKSFGSLPLKEISTNNLIVIHLNSGCEINKDECIPDCSKGTYFNEGNCHVCPEGTYSDQEGSKSCTKCMSGYYSDIKGGDSIKICQRCPYGTYNKDVGQSRCLYCPYGSTCRFDEVIPNSQSRQVSDYISVQPELLEDEGYSAKRTSLLFAISLAVVFVIFITSLIISSSSREFVKSIDLYSLQHNHNPNSIMYTRKTLIGGVFSIIFLFAALYVLFDRTVYFAVNNIREIKALVPVVALEKQYGDVIYIQIQAEQALFEFEFVGYAGRCIKENGECTDDLNIDFVNINAKYENLQCDRVDSTCYIRFEVPNFELEMSGSIGLELSETESFCSGMRFKVQTSSSIPDEISGITATIPGYDNAYFNGPDPSIISLLMTPSLFISDKDIWNNDGNKSEGYHISQTQEVIEGSKITFSE